MISGCGNKMILVSVLHLATRVGRQKQVKNETNERSYWTYHKWLRECLETGFRRQWNFSRRWNTFAVIIRFTTSNWNYLLLLDRFLLC